MIELDDGFIITSTIGNSRSQSFFPTIFRKQTSQNLTNYAFHPFNDPLRLRIIATNNLESRSYLSPKLSQIVMQAASLDLNK